MSGEDDGGEPPLADLSESIRNRETTDAPSGPWDRLDPSEPTDAAWHRLEGTNTGHVPTPASEYTVRSRWLTPSHSAETVIVTHAAFTVVALGVSLLVYLAALFHLIPRPYWVLSLPPLAIGVAGLVPIIAWLVGIWNPHEVG